MLKKVVFGSSAKQGFGSLSWTKAQDAFKWPKIELPLAIYDLQPANLARFSLNFVIDKLANASTGYRKLQYQPSRGRPVFVLYTADEQ